MISDANEELINLYLVIRDNIEELISSLKHHKNTAEYYYKIRQLDRSEKYNRLSNVQKASRFLYLNKTCFNGLYRVNKNGQFNTPYGKYKSLYFNEAALYDIRNYLNNKNINICSYDFEIMLNNLKNNDTFVYLDPPYFPISDTADFNSYTKEKFCKEDHIRLKECCDRLTDCNIKFMLSNSDSKFIRDLYKEYEILTITAPRNIRSSSQRHINEVVIKNY